MDRLAEIWNIVRAEVDIYSRREVAEKLVKLLENAEGELPEQLVEDSKVCPAELLDNWDDDWDEDEDDWSDPCDECDDYPRGCDACRDL